LRTIAKTENRPVHASKWVRRAGVVWVACLLLAGGACGTQRKSRGQRETPGGFDYYVLALSWAPAFCAHETANRGSRECTSNRDMGFVVHGLWPEHDTGGPLENCVPVGPLAREIVQQMLPVMPDAGLIRHEWRIHGSCSGLSAEEYFATVRRASEKIRVPESYRALQRALETSPWEIERRFAGVNRLRGASSIRVQCREGELREVRICLTKDLQPRPCSRSMRDCRAGELFMRPIQ